MNKRFLAALLTGAFFIASASMFVSCKDYDDDIKKNTESINALQSELASLKTSLTSELEATKASLNTALEQKADVADLTALASRVSALETQIKEIDNCAKKSDLETLATTVAELTGRVEDLEKLLGEETAARKAVEANLELQKKALEALDKELDELGLKVEANTKAIAEIRAELDKFALKSDLEQLRADMNSMNEALSKRIDNIWNWINVLNVFVNKHLTSMVLQPEFYWEGLEGVEVPYAEPNIFVEAGKYSFEYTVATGSTAGTTKVKVEVDKHMTWKGAGNCEDELVWGPTHREFYSLDYSAAPAAAKTKIISNGGILKYHINPTTADLEGLKISFWENDATHYTRGNNGAINATPKEEIFSKSGKENKFQGGILTVPFTVDEEKVTAMFIDWANTLPLTIDLAGYEPWWDSWAASYDAAHGGGIIDDDGNYYPEGAPLPFLAAQMELNDTTITSDYAVVVPAIIDIVALADKAPEEVLDKGTFVGDDGHDGHIRANHLYESTGYTSCDDQDCAGAIPMPATHSLLYNDPNGIDLKPFIETHFSYLTFAKYGTSFADQIMTDAMLEALGLHYEFKAIDYKIGGNKTGESAHVQQKGDKTSGVFVARSVNADGTTIKDQPATREAVDREPLVRVDLVDKDGEIVRYGYIKLRIVDTLPKDLSVEIELPDYWMNCGDEHAITWSQVENLILAKLGTEGMLKKEFENQYYLDVYGDYLNMPYLNPAAAGVSDPAGELYTGKWMAKRYYKKADGTYALAAGSDTDETDAASYNSFTATNNHFGEVWYTPHDNSTDAHAWDEATNVLIWNLYPGTVERDGTAKVTDKEQAGNMTKAKYHKLREVAGIDYDHPESQNAVSTVVRFKHKLNGTSIYVTLVIPKTKIHFEYGKVENKDWSHWWKFNTQLYGVESDKAPYWDEFDTHMNTPVPAYVAYRWLTVSDFKQDLRDYWHSPEEMITLLGDKSKFTKFYTAGKPNVAIDFIFTTPKDGLNSDGVTANGAGQWVVTGASGTKWTLQLSADAKKINAVKKNGATYGPEEVCVIQAAADGNSSELYYHGLEEADPKLYPAATDLLNKSGRYDETGAKRYGAGTAMGEQQDAKYFEKNVDETFTAYIKINVSHDCYDPLIAKQYFNVRVIRPINVAGKEKKIKDIPNIMQRISIRDLVDIIDYRDIPVVGRYAADQPADKNAFGFAAPAWSKVANGTFADAGYVKEQNAGVPYEFYGVRDLAVIYSEILSDHQAPYAFREKGALRTSADILAELNVNLRPVKDIPSLRGGLEGKDYHDAATPRVLSLWSNDANHSLEYNTAWPAAQLVDMTNDKSYSLGLGKIEYTNNSGITQLFHIYVPIAVKYNWGNIKWDKDLDNGKLDNNYTQKVWAVITVDPSYLGE